MRNFLIATFVLAGAYSGIAGAAVYKCTNAQGGIAFQDHACASGETESKVHFASDPPEAQPDPNAPPVETATAHGDDAPPPPPPAPPPPVPTMWFCVRAEDGTQYMSRDGNPQPRMVPAGVLGVGGKSLAQTYAPGGVGVSAPGMRQIPVDRSAQSAVAGDYVAVQDHCEQASRETTCNYLQKQYDDVHQKLRRAFKDEQAILQPQEDQLVRDIEGC
ncbi:MAG: DUF4124 domain-containing protein [Rudaea sp.]